MVNPYEKKLTFLDNRLRARRDHIKYLNLINAVTLLHQYQRPLKTVSHNGKRLSYIEVTIEDIEAANQLAAEVMGTSLDDLSPQTRKLLLTIHELVMKRCDELQVETRDLRLTRREIREFSGWTDTRLRIHLQRLVDMEYLLISRNEQGKTFVYELLYQGEGCNGQPFMMQLIDVEILKKHSYDSLPARENDKSAPHPQGMCTSSAQHSQAENTSITPSNNRNNGTTRPKAQEQDIIPSIKSEHRSRQEAEVVL